MILIDDLQRHTSDSDTLERYLIDNFQDVTDFLSYTKYSVLLQSRDRFEKYIQLNRNVILELNVSSKNNLSFISLLLDVCERLGLISCFTFLFQHLQLQDYIIGRRLSAAALYLVNIRNEGDYLDRFDSIYNLLQEAYEVEEDNQDKVLATFINYYSAVVLNLGEFNPNSLEKFKSKVNAVISQYVYSFLHDDLIAVVLSISTHKFYEAYIQINSTLDFYLGRDIEKPLGNKAFIIEEGTKYDLALKKITPNFTNIREISVQLYKPIKTDAIFHSLGRGVTILKDENQLLAYMHSFGNMHFEKLYSSFAFLPKNLFDKNLHIIDWGCGQAMATVSFFDYYFAQGVSKKVFSATLIEPSSIALKRGALHVKSYGLTDSIITINKDLDSVEVDDFQSRESLTKVHLLSNILDIELFSISRFLGFIEDNFKGENYFVCASPFINDIKVNRINTFVHYFSRKASFIPIKAIDNKKGEWKFEWTRVIRVFKVEL
ncbi:MAG: hypothetical protein JSS76_11430 [Bacteroidetes bacterium]|nr:hypothetical protein [Bacteroidota bacterium]